MKLWLAISLVFSFYSGFANGKPPGNHSLKGVVVDSSSGELLTGVKVVMAQTGEVVYTNKFGEFELLAPSEKAVELTFLLVSFEPLVVRVEPRHSAEVLSVELEER